MLAPVLIAMFALTALMKQYVHDAGCVVISFMPAWVARKFSACKDGGKQATYALLRGNGHRHVFVIRNKHKDAWNLENLASTASIRYDYLHSLEILVLACAVIIFSGLAVVSTALSDRDALFSLAILTIGTVGNTFIAVLPQKPAVHGILLKSIETITHDSKIMAALRSLKQKYAGLDEPLLKEFFPVGITKEAQAWFDNLKDSHKRAGEVGKQSEVNKVGQKAVPPLSADAPVDSEEEFDDEML
jgi:hypothetical protein